VNRRLRPKMLEMRLVEGPFRHLEGFWRFEPLDEGACRVSLDIDFEFSSKVLGLTLGPVLSMDREAKPLIPVEVAYARPDKQRIIPLEVPVGTTVREAIEASGILEAFPEIDLTRNKVGIFGRLTKPDRPQGGAPATGGAGQDHAQGGLSQGRSMRARRPFSK